VNEEMYEEIDDGIPFHRRMNAHIRTGSHGFDNRINAYLQTQFAFRAGAAWANGNADANAYVSNMFNGPLWGQQAQPQFAMPQTPDASTQSSPGPNIAMPNMTMQNLQNMQNIAMHNRNMQQMNMQQLQNMGMNQNTQPMQSPTPSIQQNQHVRQISRSASRPAPYPQPRPQSDWAGNDRRSISVKTESPESQSASPLGLVSDDIRRTSIPAADTCLQRPAPLRTPSFPEGSFKEMLKPVEFALKQEQLQPTGQMNSSGPATFNTDRNSSMNTDLLSCTLPAEAQAILGRSNIQTTPLGVAMMSSNDSMPPQSIKAELQTPHIFNHSQFGASLDGLGSTLAPAALSSTQEYQEDPSAKQMFVPGAWMFDNNDDVMFDEFTTGWDFNSNDSELFA